MPPIYAYQPTSPTASFAQGFNFVQQIRQQQAQQQRQQALQQAMMRVRENPNPQAIADFYLQFPEMKETFDAYRETLAEGDKVTLQSAAQRAILAVETGGNPADIYRENAEAAENSNRPDLAKQFRDAQRMAEMSPEAADLTARMFYQGINPDGYKAMFDKTALYDTARIKETIAEGYEYGTPEFQARMKEKEEGDPFIVVPGIGLYSRAEVEGLAEGASAAPAVPEAAIKFLVQNPKLRDDFDRKYGKGAADRILGGTSGNAGGGFRGN